MTPYKSMDSTPYPYDKPFPADTSIEFDKTLCVSTNSKHKDGQSPKLKIELLELQGTVNTVYAEAELGTHENYHNRLEMHNESRKPVCTMHLSSTVSKETFEYHIESLGPAAQSSEKKQDADMGICGTCGRAVVQTRRALADKKEKLFSKEDLEELFIDEKNLARTHLDIKKEQVINNDQLKVVKEEVAELKQMLARCLGIDSSGAVVGVLKKQISKFANDTHNEELS